jgi:hypothetical protein
MRYSMDRERLAQLIKSYRAVGVVHGREFLLPPSDAISFARDLSDLGLVITGADFWCYVDKEKGWIKQLVGADIPVEKQVPWEEMTPKRNLHVVESFLVNELPEETDLVSFLFKDPEWDDLLAEQIIERNPWNQSPRCPDS